MFFYIINESCECILLLSHLVAKGNLSLSLIVCRQKIYKKADICIYRCHVYRTMIDDNTIV
jgi:hypothetical protein